MAPLRLSNVSFEASIIEGYPEDQQPLTNTVEDLRKTPQYRVLLPRFQADFRLAAALRTLEQGGELDPARLDEIIAEMSERLESQHPVLPILTGKVPFEKPNRHLPLTFKLRTPGLKLLNSLYDPSGADALMAQIQDLVERFFGSTGQRPPVLSLVSRDAKGGKALFNLDSNEFLGKDSDAFIKEFIAKAEEFQEPLNALLREFDAAHGNKLPEGMKAQMLFGGVEAWDFGGEGAEPKTEDLVMHFIHSEYVANVAKLRFDFDPENPAPQTDDRRRSAAFIPLRRTMGIVEIELRKTMPAFEKLFKAHAEDPEWMGEAEDSKLFVPLGSDGAYCLSVYALQHHRKGTLQEAFPFLTDADVLVIQSVFEVVNTVDVLKPFLGEDIEAFSRTLEDRAALLTTEPQALEDKKAHALHLAKALRTSLKSKEGLEGDISATRFAVSEKLHKVLCTTDETEAHTLAVGDVASFGAANLLVLFKDLFTFYNKFPGEDQFNIIHDYVRKLSSAQIDELLPHFMPALKELMLTAGDEVTALKRRIDQLFAELLPGIIANIDGGDELEGVYPSPDAKDLEAFLVGSGVRMALVRLPFGHDPMELDEGAELATCLMVFAEGLMNALKYAEKVNKRISKDPVNVIIKH